MIKRYGLGLAIIALLIALFYVSAFYPGYMSFDSAHHYQQLETGEWTNFQPVIILLFWQVTNSIIEGPGGLYLCFLSIYLISLWLIACYLQGGWIRRIILLLTALFPVSIMLFPHIWKDIGLLVFVLLAIGCLLYYLSNNRWWALLASLLSLAVALLFRFEAVLYLWPLLFFQIRQATRKNNANLAANRSLHFLLRDGFLVIVFAVLVLFGNQALVKVTDTKKITLWPTIALWDIARVSIRENQVLMPDYTVGVGMTVEDLAQATHSWTNTSLFSNTKAGVNNSLATPYTPEQYKDLLVLWVSLPIKYPQSYAKHRLQLMRELMRVNEDPNKPQDLFWCNYITNYNDRFPANSSLLNLLVNLLLKRHKDSIVFKPWLYVIIAIMVVIYILRQRQITVQQRLAMNLIICSGLSLVVMLFLAPAAEQRYLIILFTVVPIAACLAWATKQPLS